MLLFGRKRNLTKRNPYLCGLIKFNNIMWIVILIVVVVIIIVAASKASNDKQSQPVKQTMQRDEPRSESQSHEEIATKAEVSSEEESESDYAGLSYEEKMKAIAKDCEKYLFQTVASLEMTREEKETLIPQFLETVEQLEDETKILKAVVRNLYKNLIANTNDPVHRADYEERFEDEKESMRSPDYVVIDSDWEQFLDDFEDLKKEKQASKPHRTIGVTVVETSTDEVDGQPCDVANFAVKGLRFRSEDDIKAACTLQVGDPLHMESEPDNEKDPNAMKVTMEDGHHIGYVDGKCSSYVKESLPRLVKFVVSKVDDYGDPPYIYAEAFFKKD